MHLVYHDESGDDGFPVYAAPMFVLSAIYGPAQDWQENFEIISGLKRQLARDSGLPFERDLRRSPQNRFLVITDEGRVARMRTTTRRMQKVNFAPSQLGDTPLRRGIRQMIADPLPKDSKESCFIQLADLMACLFYMHAGLETGVSALPARTPPDLNPVILEGWLANLKPILNLSAAPTHPYGLVLIAGS